MARITESDLFEACRFLFGTDIQLSLDFLSYLQPSGAKSAYRRKVKETHPDLFSDASGSIQQAQTEQFQKLAASYEVVCDYFKLRESGLWTPPSMSKRAAPTASASPLVPLRLGGLLLVVISAEAICRLVSCRSGYICTIENASISGC